MEFLDFINLVRRKKQTVISVVLVFLILATIMIIVQPLKYSSHSKLLIVKNFPASTDPYVISKSSEYLSNILAQVISSGQFYHDVMDSKYNIEKSYFTNENSKSKEMKKWKSTVSANVVNNTGIIDVFVYHTNREQLEQISQAVNNVLQTKHSFYHGFSSNVNIRVIDDPISSNWPTKPNILLNYSFALLTGIFISLIYIYLFPENNYNLRLFPKRKEKKDEQDIAEVSNSYQSKDNKRVNLNNYDIYNDKKVVPENDSIKYTSIKGSMNNIIG